MANPIARPATIPPPPQNQGLSFFSINLPTYHHSFTKLHQHIHENIINPAAPPLWKQQKSTRRVGVAASIGGEELVENDGSVSVDLNAVFEVES